MPSDAGNEYVPEFNSLVAFKVPRYHQVTAVASSERPRYSIFGWFLQPGKLYELYAGKEENRESFEGNKPPFQMKKGERITPKGKTMMKTQKKSKPKT